MNTLCAYNFKIDILPHLTKEKHANFKKKIQICRVRKKSILVWPAAWINAWNIAQQNAYYSQHSHLSSKSNPSPNTLNSISDRSTRPSDHDFRSVFRQVTKSCSPFRTFEVFFFGRRNIEPGPGTLDSISFSNIIQMDQKRSIHDSLWLFYDPK